jgi:hypothetical protein
MSFEDDVREGLSWRYGLVVCFLFFMLSLITQSWLLFILAILILALGPIDLWMWWLPGMSRRGKAEIPLTGARERKLRTRSPHEWIVQCVGYFRSVGFFANAADDEAVARRLESEGFNPTHLLADFRVLKADEDRVWTVNVGGQATAGNRAYENTLAELGRISHGSFAPTDIGEMWEDDAGPVLVEFTHDRRRHMLQPDALDGDLDLGILEPINEIIGDSGYRFEEMIVGPEIAVLCLTPEERQRLTRDRGWRFI